MLPPTLFAIASVEPENPKNLRYRRRIRGAAQPQAAWAICLLLLVAILFVSCKQSSTVQDNGKNTNATQTEESNLVMDPNANPPGEHRDWKVSLRGWGKLKIGMSLQETKRLLPFGLDSINDIEPGQECSVLVPADAPSSYAFMFTGNGDSATLVRIYIDVPSVHTLSGISVGSKESDVQKAYGSKLKTEPHKYVEGWKDLIYVPVDEADKNLRLVFTTDGKVVQQMSVGRLPEILYSEACN